MTHLEHLAADPQRHHFFHALRLIEAGHPEHPRHGTSLRPSQDRVRLGQEAELAFPPSTIAGYLPPTPRAPGRLTNRFFGLFGPQGPLPLHLTEYARDRLRNHRDGAIVGLADMLTHRLTGLLYRAWRSGQPAPSFDSADGDVVETRLAALAGYHGAALRDRDALPDLARRHFTGHLAQGAKTAEGLASMLSAFFRAPVRVQQFVGAWLDLEASDRWQLGARAGLGRATSIGTRVWSRSAKFRLRIGPMSHADYCRLLPGSGALDRLEAIVRSHVGDLMDWDVNLVLGADQVPAAVLGRDTRLGHTSWIGDRGGRGDAADLFLVPPSVARRGAGPAVCNTSSKGQGS